jgi:hypothetical protein
MNPSFRPPLLRELKLPSQCPLPDGETDTPGLISPTSSISFSVWKRTLGMELELPEKGQKAKWLGGNVVSVSSAAASSQ